jgi:hypothetical protein
VKVKPSRRGWVRLDVAATEAFLRHILDGSSETDQDTTPRPINTTPLFPLHQIWPEVVEGLAALLAQTGEAALSESIRELDVYDRCRCGAHYCSTVYTQPRISSLLAERSGQNRHNHRNVVFWSAHTICVDTGLPASSSGHPAAPNTTILDIVDDEIVCIEILDDAESRARLLAALPDLS